LAADLPNLFCDRYPTYQYLATVNLPHYQWSERVLYPYIQQILAAFAIGIPICTGNTVGKFFALTALDLLN
jgi:hypothetical protein